MSNQYQHKVRVGVVIVDSHKILMVRQNNRPFWVFPGGTLELGESIFDCGIREIQEELNLEIGIEKILYLADFIQTDFTSTKHTVDVFLLAQYNKPGHAVMTLDENLNEMDWFSFSRLSTLPVQPSIVMQRVLKDIHNSFDNANGLYLGTYGPSD